MKHYARRSFWEGYRKLPSPIQRLADKQYQLLKSNPSHPSLHFKKIYKRLWSVRVNFDYRACAIQLKTKSDFAWFFIGLHAEYEKLIKAYRAAPRSE